MDFSENEKAIIAKNIADVLDYGHKSYYLEKENTVVRISNHLPNEFNFRAFNENAEKIVLLGVGISENDLENWKEANSHLTDEIEVIEIDGDIINSNNWFEMPSIMFL